eukprot:SAG31_NODE_2593_length_5423_cov_21.402705_2_plen_156_part_00
MDDEGKRWLSILKKTRKDIRQNNFNKKIFLAIVKDYTEKEYRRGPKFVNDAIRLILKRGESEDGTNDLGAALVFSGLKNTVENDFLIFVRAFQILFKFAGSRAYEGGRDEVMLFANKLQEMLGFKMVVVGELPNISTLIGVTTNGREIIIKEATL